MALFSTNQGAFGFNTGFDGLDWAMNTLTGHHISSNKPYESDVSSNLEIDGDPVGDTYRGPFSDWFNSKNIAKEDFKRGEQAADNQLKRDLYLFEQNKAFSREQMEWQERMANSSYQRAVEDMKKAGINPVMAINQGGAATPSVPSASSGRSSSRYSNADGFNSAVLVSSLISLIAGVYGAASKNATQLAIAQLGAQSRDYATNTGVVRDEQWRYWYDNNKRR